MNTTALLPILVGSMTLAGTLIAGYLQRKQMRQNELFRLDPSAGLTPPPHPLWTHLWESRIFYFNCVLSALLLTVGFLVPKGPMDRGSVLNISMGVGLFYYALAMSVVERTINTQTKIVRVLENHRDTVNSHDQILAITVDNVHTIAKTAAIPLDNLALLAEIEKYRRTSKPKKG